MRLRIYEQDLQLLFPLYISTVAENHNQEVIIRDDGYEMTQLFTVVSGNGILELAGETHTIGKNDMFYISQDTPHRYYSSGDEFNTAFISFFGDGFEGIKAHYGLGEYGVYKGKDNSSFYKNVRKLYSSIETVREIPKLCADTFNTVISFFESACKQEYSDMENVYNFLETNYSKPLTLEDILTVYPFSKSKLCAEFKEKYNQTIFEALTGIRLEHARYIIGNSPRLPLKTVSELCGFNDVSYFCKMYKKHWGTSPKKAITNTI